MLLVVTSLLSIGFVLYMLCAIANVDEAAFSLPSSMALIRNSKGRNIRTYWGFNYGRSRCLIWIAMSMDCCLLMELGLVAWDLLFLSIALHSVLRHHLLLEREWPMIMIISNTSPILLCHVSVSVSLLELLINVFGISLTNLTLNHLRKRGQGVEDERSERQRTDKDSRKFYNLMMGLTLALLPGQSDSQDTHPKYNSPQVAPKISTSPPAHLPPLPQTVTPLLTTTKPLVKKKSSNSPKPQQRLVTNSHKPEAKKSFIAPQSDACKDQVSTTLVKRLRSQNTASKVPDQQVNEEASEDQRLVSSRARKPSFFAQQRSCNGLMIELDDQPICQEQIKIDKRRQNTKDVQEHTCPVEAIGQTMLNVSQNQSHFECPIVQELTKPVVVDVALLNHIVSQDKGWTECPLVSESHYKHGMGAGFLTSVSVVLNTRFWFGPLVSWLSGTFLKIFFSHHSLYNLMVLLKNI
ncbi:hypothetical protein PPACK8108_LOCUS9411 [Phakopsora pachyrhizi]|uniref:Uncharacterized protein n=1 Tax=Phakopsora pachyrhizi TaxID=170000 RepID=A0AAV0AYX1_PHAPC|nr:hypothetical protein PPACK8108_LOCUS9411 [Phakopsora pachyrhizi]